METVSTLTNIELEGVRVHNLKSISLEIPLQQLTVITGVSGSGKSSLAFDTLYAEGHRRYLETMSLSARHFLTQMERPDADRVENIPPSIALKQNISFEKSKATVASTSEIDLFLAELFCREGVTYCSKCDIQIRAFTVDEAAQEISQLPEGLRYQIAFAVQIDDQTDVEERKQELKELGFTRFTKLEFNNTQPAEFVIADRLKSGATDTQRISEAIDNAWRNADGVCWIIVEKTDRLPNQDVQSCMEGSKEWMAYRINRHAVCQKCDAQYETPNARRLCKDLLIVGNDASLQPKLKINNASLVETIGYSVDSLRKFLEESINENDSNRSLLLELDSRIHSLIDLGLGHLPLNRKMKEISTGEAQRIALSQTVMSGLVDTLYVLDEPSSGLHFLDTEKVRESILQLREQGNSVVLVEHNHEFLVDADRVIDIGPSAGSEGGEIVFNGSFAEFTDCENSLTAQWLEKKKALKRTRLEQDSKKAILLRGARTKNLKSLDAVFPLNSITVITGVSGSGKTSLVMETLSSAVHKNLDSIFETDTIIDYDSIAGIDQIDECVVMNAEPLSRSGRSCPATYLKIYDEIRATFAETLEAKKRNFSASDFSFNVAKGKRCKNCQGKGTVLIEMQFIADMPILCPECHGSRFERELLEAKYRGRSIADVLSMTVEEAFPFFRSQQKIQRSLQSLRSVGLNYLPLGQSLNSLSGGESQRLKLATYLSSASGKQSLFLFDEPTNGLHPENVVQLIECFDQLISMGHTVIVIANDEQLLAESDYVLELGPKAGDAGGEIVASGQTHLWRKDPQSNWNKK